MIIKKYYRLFDKLSFLYYFCISKLTETYKLFADF